MSITSTVVQRADIRFHEAPERPAAASSDASGWSRQTGTRRSASCLMAPHPFPFCCRTTSHPDGFCAVRWFDLRSDDSRRRHCSIGVRLRPGVAFIISGIPAHAIVGRHIRLSDTGAFHELVSGEASLHTTARVHRRAPTLSHPSPRRTRTSTAWWPRQFAKSSGSTGVCRLRTSPPAAASVRGI